MGPRGCKQEIKRESTGFPRNLGRRHGEHHSRRTEPESSGPNRQPASGHPGAHAHDRRHRPHHGRRAPGPDRQGAAPDGGTEDRRDLHGRRHEQLLLRRHAMGPERAHIRRRDTSQRRDRVCLSGVRGGQSTRADQAGVWRRSARLAGRREPLRGDREDRDRPRRAIPPDRDRGARTVLHRRRNPPRLRHGGRRRNARHGRLPHLQVARRRSRSCSARTT